MVGKKGTENRGASLPRLGHTVESLGFNFKFRCPWGGDSLVIIIAHVAAEYKVRFLSRMQLSCVYRCRTLALLRTHRAHKARSRPQVKLATDPKLDLADIPPVPAALLSWVRSDSLRPLLAAAAALIPYLLSFLLGLVHRHYHIASGLTSATTPVLVGGKRLINDCVERAFLPSEDAMIDSWTRGMNAGQLGGLSHCILGPAQRGFCRSSGATRSGGNGNPTGR
jgi:hypothetical protein